MYAFIRMIHINVGHTSIRIYEGRKVMVSSASIVLSLRMHAGSTWLGFNAINSVQIFLH